MRKKYWLYILLVCLLAAAVLTIVNRKAGTFRGVEGRFAVSDTGSVSLIEIRSKRNTVTLERSQGSWVVNNNYPAENKKIATLLMVLSRLQVSAPVPVAIKDEIRSKLKEDAKRVEVIADRRNPHVLLMYQDTVHTNATCMMLEQSDQPFRVELPGYPGRNLSGLFVDDVNYWRDNSIFRLREEEIISVSMYNRIQPETSFYVVNTKGAGYKLFTYPDSTEIKDFDPGQVKQYISYFTSVQFERFMSDQEKKDQNFLNEGKPDNIIMVRDSKNNLIKVETFPLYVHGQQNQSVPDINRLIAVINDTDVVVARYMDLDPVIKDISYFLEKEKNNLYN